MKLKILCQKVLEHVVSWMSQLNNAVLHLVSSWDVDKPTVCNVLYRHVAKSCRWTTSSWVPCGSYMSSNLKNRGIFIVRFLCNVHGLGCTVVLWLAPSHHSKRVPGSTPSWGLSVWSLHVLPVYEWVLSGYSGFLPLSKNMHVRLIGVSKIVLRSECERVWLFVSFVSVWQCDGLATCPGCTPPMTVGVGSSPPTTRPTD